MSANTRPQSCQLAEPLWTDSALKSGISMRELISTLKNKNKKKPQAGNEWSDIFFQNPFKREKNSLLLAQTKDFWWCTQGWAEPSMSLSARRAQYGLRKQKSAIESVYYRGPKMAVALLHLFAAMSCLSLLSPWRSHAGSGVPGMSA